MRCHCIAVDKLAHQPAPTLPCKAFGFFHSSCHAADGRRQHQFSAITAQEHPPLAAHGFWHGQDALQAAHSRNQRNANAHIAAGGFNHKAAWAHIATHKSPLHTAKGHAILD